MSSGPSDDPGVELELVLGLELLVDVQGHRRGRADQDEGESEEDAEEAAGHQAGCSGLSNGRMIMDTVK